MKSPALGKLVEIFPRDRFEIPASVIPNLSTELQQIPATVFPNPQQN